MVNLIKAKNCDIITHVEVPTDILTPNSKKRKSMEDKESTPGQYNNNQAYKKVKGKKPRMDHAHNKELAAWFQNPIKEAGHPGLSHICKYCGLTSEQLLSSLGR